MSDDDETTYSTIKTLFGRTRRDQRWHLTDEVDVLTVLGGAKFDLRDVETSGTDAVEIAVTCLLGTVELLVPEGAMVVLDGTSLLASAQSRVAPGPSVALPRLEVTATTVLGRVRVRSPRPGEEPEAEAGEPAAAVVPEPQPVAEPATEPLAEPATEPVAEPVTNDEPVAEITAEAVAEPEPVTDAEPEAPAEPADEAAPAEVPS